MCLHGLVEFGRTLGLLSISAMETIEGEGRLSSFSLPQFVHLYNGNNVSTSHGDDDDDDDVRLPLSRL